MIVTNKHNLPEALVKFLTIKTYVPGNNDYSVTTLLKPPRIVQLERRHNDKIEEDVIDNLWSVFGSAVHDLLEKHAHDDATTEQRYYCELLSRRVGGQIDNYHDGVLTDYKVTSAYTIVFGSRISEWTLQQNIYAYLLRKHGNEVNKIQICAIIRDWDKNKVNQEGYPKLPIMLIDLEMLNDSEIEAIIEHHLQMHIECESVADDYLPYCTNEETWQKQTVYAVKKEGRKTAVKLFSDWVEADEFIIEANDKKLYIETRQGKRVRCSDYCACNKFCNQYQEYLRSLNVED